MRTPNLFFLHSCVFVLCFCVIAASSIAQEDDIGEMELIQRVAELQLQLESSKISERETAEKELMELGSLVLDHLEPPSENAPSDVAERLGRVRMELEKIAVASVTEASQVTLKGKLTIVEALKQIKEQTENDIALGEQIPDVIGEKQVELDMENVTFWTAAAEVMKQGGLIVDPYSGEPGQLRLAPTQAARMAAANPDLPQQPKKVQDAPPQANAGIFNLMVNRINSSRNLVEPERNFCNISVLVRWEPRVQPISIDLPIKTIKAVDEFDSKIEVPNPETVLSGIVQPEIPELEFSIPIGLVDRQIETIKSFDAVVDAVLPGRSETFKFKKIGDLKAGKTQKKAGAIVQFDGVRKNEDLFGVTVRLSFDESSNALASHQGWAFNNPMYLIDGEDNQHQPIGYETLAQNEEEIAIQYYFEDDPKDWTLVYKTPAAIVRVPIKVKLTNIPLP